MLLFLSACAAGKSPDGPGTSGTTAPQGSTGEPSAETGKTITFALPSFPGSWDQDFIGFDLAALAMFKNVLPYMVDYSTKEVSGGRIQDTENIPAAFAESFTPDESRKVWTLKLKKGVKFPSGNEMTAADVKWSKDRAFAAQANVAGVYRLIGLTEADQVKVIDDHTVEFHQAFPSALTEQIQAISLYIYDSVECKKHATDDDPWAKDWMAKNPQDGGYYNVSSSVQNQEIVLTANPEYTGDDAPKIDTIRMPIVSSAATLRLQLENGDIDVAMGMSRRDIADLRDKPGIEVISSPNNELTAIQMSVVTAPFDDVKVRQALAYAVPYEEIINNIYNGDARPVKSPIPLDMPGYSEKGYPYEYNPEKAKELLAEAGHSSLATELVIESDNSEQQEIAVLIADRFKAVGVDLEITPLDPATMAERREKRSIPMQLTVGQAWVNDVEYQLSISLTEGAALNFSNYSNPEIEEIFQKSHEITDVDERLGMWERVQEILGEDVPWLIIAQPNFNLPVREGIIDWVQPVDGLFRLRYLDKK